MTATYTNSPATSTRDAVRIMLYDTDVTNNALLTDEEIAYFLAEEGSVKRAAAAGARAIAARFGRMINRSAIDISDSPGQSADFYLRLAEELEARSSRLAEVFAGGRTHSGKSDLDNDSDAVQPPFRLDQFRNTGGSETVVRVALPGTKGDAT